MSITLGRFQIPMTEDLHDRNDVRPVLHALRRPGVPQIMEADPLQSGPLQQGRPGGLDRFQRLPVMLALVSS